MAGLALTRTLGCLGAEGECLGLLRAAVPMRHLLFIKLLVNLVYVLAWVPAYSMIVAATAGIYLSQSVEWTSLIPIGITSGIILVVLGSALGFMFPDFDQRSLLLPGASRAGQFLFLSLAPLTLAGTRIWPSGTRPGFTIGNSEASGLLFAAGLILPISSLAWAIGLYRASRMEQ